jgi:Abortive infection C-terminus
MAILDELRTDYERADALVSLLVDRATGASPDETDFLALRKYFVDHPELSPILPTWFVSKRSLNQFWGFIKNRFSTYAERRTYLWSEFEPLLARVEVGTVSPAEDSILEGLKLFNAEAVTQSWRRIVQRAQSDPEGAITASRNLLETVLKHVLDERGISYDHDGCDLPELYRLVSKELGLAPEQHQEPIFKQVLGGCSGIVSGLGSLRNKLGDAHGKGINRARPAVRHAKLALNLAGSMALFLIETHKK